MSVSPRLKFGSFELDLRTSELWQGGERQPLPPKPAKVLAMLASAPGVLIDRETFRQQLWGSETYVDFEHGLNFCIRKIRAALGDDARQPKYVETLPKRGYRFVARMEPLAEKPAAPTSESALVAANEHYAKARRAFGKFAKESLDEAAQEFRRALDLQPDYAMAHSGLGATLSLRMLNRRDPAELATALEHLERAVSLDAELAEPYPWLCFARIRSGETALAIVAGRRGTALQPDLAQAHYFLGLAYLATAEEGQENYQQALRHLLDAARVGPYWHPTWFVLAYVTLLNGEYARAEGYAQRLLDATNKPGNPFVGAELVLASAWLRQGDPARAREILTAFLQRMLAVDHMYRDAMTAVADCVLGEVELRERNFDAALVAFRRGWQTLQEHTRVVAHARISARAQAGMAHAYFALGQPDKAAPLREKAVAETLESTAVSCAAAGANLAELFLSVAALLACSGDQTGALEMVERATASGWRDAAWLERDPLLAELRQDARFQNCIHRIRQAPRLTWES